MKSDATPNAYLVTSLVSIDGEFCLQSETICFDRDLAIAIADDEGNHCTWVGVYALDPDGRSVQDGALYSSGSLHGRAAGRVGHRPTPGDAGVSLS